MDFNSPQWAQWARLMERAQEGDGEAYERLLAGISPLVYAYVRRRVFNPNAVDDVYQDAMFTFHKARHTYQPDRHLGPWFYTVLRNAVLTSLGKMRRVSEKEVLVEEIPEEALEKSGEPGLDDRMQKALDQLPQKSREALELLKIEGLDVETASKRIGITKSALKVRAHRGYLKLRRAFLEVE